MVPPTPLERIAVKTSLPSLPYPPTPSRPIIKTERLLLRPYARSDLEDIYALRSQPEVMRWSPTGTPDLDMETSRSILEAKLSAKGERNVNYVVCLLSTGEMIGVCGVHNREGFLGWPMIGYMLRKEAWGEGYATEMVRGMMRAWWELPRMEAEIKVDRNTLADEEIGEEGVVVRECVTAITVEENTASRGVLRKCGFELGKILVEKDLRDLTQTVELYCYVARRPESGDELKQ